LTLGREPPQADVALVRLLTAMNAHMSLQVAFVRETLIAYIAGEYFYPKVTERVKLQRRGSVKGLIAVIAFVLLWDCSALFGLLFGRLFNRLLHFR
jgi:hypothetical protein